MHKAITMKFDQNNCYTYGDYLNFPDDIRAEIIDGKVYIKYSGNPPIHQKLLLEIMMQLHPYFKAKNKCCHLYMGPVDVVFVKEGQELKCSTNVVQPDIMVVCDKEKLSDPACIIGAPDTIIEIVSDDDPCHDYVRKLNLYNSFKVKEYWIVNPYQEYILIYLYKEPMGYLPPAVYSFKDKIKVNLFDDLEIDFAKIKEYL
ncbi:Uma2 family endonuclease [Caldicellulosiruptor acetigenus]|uniref:Uma2 family endonuclease n=1 Tax=Caldicellulosiruptor acetigenus TaxID=301953 RepID=UPI001E64FF47|nr:Uma2 family endonuclease [Caldicellulosiruptor acetigenus]WAM36479.1 Uma2 family endonuclease [Caldicellulosiruptor acetigenus]